MTASATSTASTDRRGIDLRADLAMRTEDARIARKHLDEAADRSWSVENHRAYRRALAWSEECGRRESQARGALIRYLQGA